VALGFAGADFFFPRGAHLPPHREIKNWESVLAECTPRVACSVLANHSAATWPDERNPRLTEIRISNASRPYNRSKARRRSKRIEEEMKSRKHT